MVSKTAYSIWTDVEKFVVIETSLNVYQSLPKAFRKNKHYWMRDQIVKVKHETRGQLFGNAVFDTDMKPYLLSNIICMNKRLRNEGDLSNCSVAKTYTYFSGPMRERLALWMHQLITTRSVSDSINFLASWILENGYMEKFTVQKLTEVWLEISLTEDEKECIDDAFYDWSDELARLRTSDSCTEKMRYYVQVALLHMQLTTNGTIRSTVHVGQTFSYIEAKLSSITKKRHSSGSIEDFPVDCCFDTPVPSYKRVRKETIDRLDGKHI